MSTADRHNDRLSRLRQWRNKPEPDLSLGFLKKTFKQQVEKPHKQMGDLAPLWLELVPADLAQHTKLEGFSRGVLRIAVDSSSRLYELDTLLRGGLELELKRRHKGTLAKVKLHVGEA